MQPPDTIGLRLSGHVMISDPDTGEVIVDKANAINPEAMSYALALALGDRATPTGHLVRIAFGNGASSTSSIGAITYSPPNVSGLTATLHRETYWKYIDDNSPTVTDPTDNNVQVNHTPNLTYSDVVISCLLDYNEPSGQAAFDDASLVNGTFIFDELGLSTFDPNSSISTGFLLSHVIFHPIQKSLNRRIRLVYTLRIVMT